MKNVFKTTENKSIFLIRKIVFSFLVVLVSFNIFTVYVFANTSASATASVLPASNGSGGGGGSYSPVPSPVTKKGDANKDNKVDKYDFSLMMASWGKTGINACDFNDDKKVDKYDFALLMLSWSK